MSIENSETSIPLESFNRDEFSGPFRDAEAFRNSRMSMPNGSAHPRQECDSFGGEDDGPFRSHDTRALRFARPDEPEGTFGSHPDERRGSPDDGSPHRPPTNFTEDRQLGRTLGTLDVSALILNKMVGTGIFTTPGIVLSLTRSKGLSVGFWVLGGLYSILNFSIYLEYGINFPYNGGDLIYLDEVWPSPELLSTVLYSGYFICFGNSSGNSVAFAKHVLAASSAEVVLSTTFDKRLVGLVAVVIMTVICFLNYFSKDAGLFLNRLLAW